MINSSFTYEPLRILLGKESEVLFLYLHQKSQNESNMGGLSHEVKIRLHDFPEFMKTIQSLKIEKS